MTPASMTGRQTILFDVSRLLIREALTSPTGIDRTTEAYAAWLLGRADIDLRPVCTWGGMIWQVSRASLERLVRRKAAARGPGDDTAWLILRRALAEEGPPTAAPLRAKGRSSRVTATVQRYAPAVLKTLLFWRPATIPPGSIYLNVSHFGLEQPGVLDRLSARGIRSVVMIHDLIPIQHPEYCSPSARRLHEIRVDAVCRNRALVISNSAATAEDLAAYAATHHQASPPVCVAPLGLEAAFLKLPPPSWPCRPYFVCIGTLEPRKNVTFLLTLWRRLAERMGAAAPTLVLVGQRGWENESVLDHLERSPPILRLVHEANSLTDAQLVQLMHNARAILAPSFTEGFDLPVNEALALGVPVIASDIAVHREFVGHAQLIDPLDGMGWLAAIEAACHQRPIVRSRPRPHWADHFSRVAVAMGLEVDRPALKSSLALLASQPKLRRPDR
jgi:glycosyltransferase involved in cell wall biosynthesis